MTYKLCIGWVDLRGELPWARIDCSLAFRTDQRHLSLEYALVVAVRVGHADALSKDVLLNNSLGLGMIKRPFDGSGAVLLG